ncbi:MAG: hypothetical protein MRY21_07420 [Simkaniaceae bacterium]|nr:hypothetical protein [Simkaniaceae bacterium]
MTYDTPKTRQLILLNFNDLVLNKPLIFSPFQLFDQKVESELTAPIPKDTGEKTQLERI